MVANIQHSITESGVINISIVIDEGLTLYPLHSLENLVLKIKSVVESHTEPREQIIERMKEVAKPLYGITVSEKALSYKTQFDFQNRTYSFYDKDLIKLRQKKVDKKKELFEEAGILMGELLPNEIFKQVPNTRKEIMVSNLGRVYIADEGLKVKFSGFVDRGYIRINIGNKRKYLHQIVAQLFLDHVIAGHNLVVDHINHNTLDNRVVNLQILTNAQNVIKGMQRKKELKILNTMI